MKLKTYLQTILLILIASISGMALGGGGSKSPPEDDTVRITMKPLQEQEEKEIYGWVRITPDKFSVGANRLEPGNYYAVYLVSGEKRQAMTEKPVRRSFNDGEFKFETRLKEPFGGEWDKVVLYHRPNGEKDENGEVAVLEGTLE